VSENTVLRRIWLALGRISILFRIQTGRAWISADGSDPIRLDDGAIMILNPRPITLGFGMANGKAMKGVGDLGGYTSMVITPEMVGCWVAVFTSIEIKEDEDSRRRPEQKSFVCQVQAAGGIAGFAHTPEMAIEIVRSYSPIRKSS
jgi:hypothetical protein